MLTRYCTFIACYRILYINYYCDIVDLKWRLYNINMKYISILIGLKYSVLKKNNFTYLNDTRYNKKAVVSTLQRFKNFITRAQITH